MTHLKSMTQKELETVLKELGQPAFRSKQLFSWLHKGVRSYDEMTNLPKSLRDALERQYPLHIPQVVRRQESQKDGTIKYLWKLRDSSLNPLSSQIRIKNMTGVFLLCLDACT